MTAEKSNLCLSDGSTLKIIDNKQLSDNCVVDLVLDNPSAIVKALQQQYRQYFYNGDPESLRFCNETIANLVNKPEVLSQLAQNGPFLELLTHMLDGQNDQLVVAISELICHLSMDFQLDCSLLRNSGVFKSMINVGKAAKKLDNEPVLVSVLKALEYWTLVSVDNRKQILDIDGALQLVTSSLTFTNRDRKWWERSPTCRRIVHNIVYFFQTSAFHNFLFRLLCHSIVYKLWDYCFTPFNPRIPFGSGRNCGVIRDYLQNVGWYNISEAQKLLFSQRSLLILDNKAIYDLTVKYRPTRFPPRFLLDDPSIKFLLILREHRVFSWKDNFISDGKFYEEYELFNPFLPPLTVVHHASSLLANLSKDRFHGHETSMTHFRQYNIFSLLSDENMDFRELPVRMSSQERLLIQENACQTLVNVQEIVPKFRTGSEEWKSLLELESSYGFIFLREKPLDPNDYSVDIFEKLISLRTGYKSKIDKIMLKIGSTIFWPFWIAFAAIYLISIVYLWSFAYFQIYIPYIFTAEDEFKNMFVLTYVTFLLVWGIITNFLFIPGNYKERQFTTRINFYSV